MKEIETSCMCFDEELAYGTILYGTLFNVGPTRFFTCEDIHFYKGNRVENRKLEDKMDLMKGLFREELKQKSYGSSFIIPGLPLFFANRQAALTTVPSLPYQVYGLRMYNLSHRNQNLGIEVIRAKIVTEAMFRVKATIQADIYDIFCFEHGKSDVPYGTAMVPTYKRSVMMNGLFRTIKENRNLDLLEESDDEEEFENIREDKFVNLDKSIVMRCVYIKKFRKWEPQEVINIKTKLVTRKEAALLEKKV